MSKKDQNQKRKMHETRLKSKIQKHKCITNQELGSKHDTHPMLIKDWGAGVTLPPDGSKVETNTSLEPKAHKV